MRDLDLESAQRWTIRLSCRSDTLNSHEFWETQYIRARDPYFRVLPRGEAERELRKKVHPADLDRLQLAKCCAGLSRGRGGKLCGKLRKKVHPGPELA